MDNEIKPAEVEFVKIDLKSSKKLISIGFTIRSIRKDLAQISQ